VMAPEHTFWEKATAVYVYCLQGRLRGDRYSRHWYDLAAIARSTYFETAVTDGKLAKKVAEHKSMFFPEKDGDGNKIDYHRAVSGQIQLIPTGKSLVALDEDYSAMLEDGLLALHQPDFGELVENCREIEARLNQMYDTN